LPRSHHEFLPRNHSVDYGHLDKSNWKDLDVEANLERLDPAIQPLLSLLREKGFTTFSSCSGGHSRDMRTRDGLSRHGEGYVAFSPPSRIVFKLFFALQEKDRRFDFHARVTVENEDQSSEQTVDSQLRWQLKHRYIAKRKYYDELFKDMMQIVEKLNSASEKDALLRTTFGPEASKAQRVLDRQQTRFGH